MSASLIAFTSGIAVILVAVVDWRRGKTGFFKLRLDKQTSPDKFWYAIILYINMGIGLIWLSSQLYEPEPISMSVEIDLPASSEDDAK